MSADSPGRRVLGLILPIESTETIQVRIAGAITAMVGTILGAKAVHMAFNDPASWMAPDVGIGLIAMALTMLGAMAVSTPPIRREQYG